jgi:hypothetical protein
MSIYIYTERFIFSCTDEGKRISCLKFGIDGQFVRVISVAEKDEGYYIIDDAKKEIRSEEGLLAVTKQYINAVYGKIEVTFKVG